MAPCSYPAACSTRRAQPTVAGLAQWGHPQTELLQALAVQARSLHMLPDISCICCSFLHKVPVLFSSACLRRALYLCNGRRQPFCARQSILTIQLTWCDLQAPPNRPPRSGTAPTGRRRWASPWAPPRTWAWAPRRLAAQWTWWMWSLSSWRLEVCTPFHSLTFAASFAAAIASSIHCIRYPTA